MVDPNLRGGLCSFPVGNSSHQSHSLSGLRGSATSVPLEFRLDGLYATFTDSDVPLIRHRNKQYDFIRYKDLLLQL